MNIKIIQNLMNKRLWSCLLSTAFLAACYGPLEEYQRTTVDINDEKFYVVETKEEREQGKFSYMYSHVPSGAKINQMPNFCDMEGATLYVKMHNHSSINSDAFANIVMTTLEQNDFFGEIVTRTPTIYINVEPDLSEVSDTGERWYNTDDPLSIYQIKKRYPDPNLLILEVRMQEFAKYDPIVVTWDLIDPNGGRSILSLRESQAAWYWPADTQTKAMIDEFNFWLRRVKQYCDCDCGGEDLADIRQEIKKEKNIKETEEIKVVVKKTPSQEDVKITVKEKSSNNTKSLIYR